MRYSYKDRPCSKCGMPRQRDGRYCVLCHNAYMRNWRKSHPLDGEARRRALTRSHTNVLLKRGILKKLVCQQCGDVNSQAHHPDYNDARNVIWLCRACHMKHHHVK